MFKKILSVIMATSMLLSVFAFSLTSANAESNSPQITGVTGYAESEDPSHQMGDAVDGNTETFWHTKFESDDVVFETDTNNSYYLDLGKEYVVDKFEYMPKQTTDKNGKITDFELYGTLDTDRATASWKLIDTVSGWTYGTAGDGMESHTLEITDPQPYRMLRVKVKGSTSNDGDPHDFICAAEFKVYGTENETEASVWEYEPVGDDSARITNYTGTDVNVVIPETVDGRTVSSIGAMSTSTSVFAEAYNSGVMIESVEIPDTVKLINQCAFRGIASLKTVKMSQIVTEIRTNAFLDCSSLESIDLPETVEDIGNNAFIGCAALKTIIIRGTNTYITNDNLGTTSSSRVAFGFMDTLKKQPIEGIQMIGHSGSRAEEFANKYNNITFISLEDYEKEDPIYMDASKFDISYNAETGYNAEPWSYYAVNASGEKVELTTDTADVDLSDTTSKSDKSGSTYRVGKYGFNTNPDSTGYTEIGYRFTAPYEGTLSVDFTRDIFGSNNGNASEMYIKIGDNAVATYTKTTSDRAATTEDKAINSKWNYIYLKGDFTVSGQQVAANDTVSVTGKMGGSYNKNMWLTPVITYSQLSSKSMLQYYKDVYVDSLDLSEAKKTEIDTYISTLPSADEITYEQAQTAVLAIDEIIARDDTLLGDVNGDGAVDISDATLIQQYLVGIKAENFNKDVADVNEDGKISIYDATAIQIKVMLAN